MGYPGPKKSKISNNSETPFRGIGRPRSTGVHTARFWVVEVCSPVGCCKNWCASVWGGLQSRVLGWVLVIFEGLHALEQSISGRDMAKPGKTEMIAWYNQKDNL